MKSKETVLMEHLSEGKSERMRKFLKLVDYGSSLAAMDEHAKNLAV